MGSNEKSAASCDTCAYLIYDEEYEGYICDIDMDEDDFRRVTASGFKSCPYYRNGDEYAVVKKQM